MLTCVVRPYASIKTLDDVVIFFMASAATIRTPWTSSVIQVFAGCLFTLFYLNYLIIVFGYR